MKLLIAVGGGGHFSPALAVIKELPKDWDILLVGRKYTFEGDSTLSLEYRTAQRLGLPFYSLTTGRLQRTFSQRTVISLLKIPIGGVQALQIVKQYKPDVILSFGGYVSVPVAFAAKLLGIPMIIHEQTLRAGLANKIAGKFADKICISWKESATFFPKEKIVLTGNPIRSDFIKLKKSQNAKPAITPKLYITGGSGGAHGINLLVEGCLEALLRRYEVVHQTGDAHEFNDYERLSEKVKLLPESLQKKYTITKFVHPEEVGAIMENADVIISRSGMNTVTELLYLGKVCLFIPLPYGQQDEQKTNALFVKSLGLGEVAEQHVLTPDLFLQKIDTLIAQYPKYKSHASSAQQLIKENAAQHIISLIKDVKKKKS